MQLLAKKLFDNLYMIVTTQVSASHVVVYRGPAYTLKNDALCEITTAQAPTRMIDARWLLNGKSYLDHPPNNV